MKFYDKGGGGNSCEFHGAPVTDGRRHLLASRNVGRGGTDRRRVQVRRKKVLRSPANNITVGWM
jgi:hypothetical protein